LMEKGLALAERLGDTAGVIEAARRLGHALVVHTAEINRGLGLHARGFEAARKMGNPVTISDAAVRLSREHGVLRDTETALGWAGQAVAAARQAGTVKQQISAALVLAGACILRGDAAQALSSLEAGEQTARKAGVGIGSTELGFGASIFGTVNICLGEWDKAETRLLYMLEVAEQLHSQPTKQLWANPALGWLFLERGELARAKTHLGESVSYCQTVGDNPPELYARALLTQVCSKSGELEEATAHMRRAREIFSLSPDWLGLAAEVCHAEGVLATAQQRWKEAEAAFQKAVEINRQYHLPYYEARSLLEWGEMYLARGKGAASGAPTSGVAGGIPPGQDRELGMELLDQALAIFQRVQAKKMVEKVLARKEPLGA
jgi:tetratricopeptide (TPR) repeat protein